MLTLIPSPTATMPKTTHAATKRPPTTDLVSRRLREGDVSVLEAHAFSEDALRTVAERIAKDDAFGTVFRLIDELPKRGERYDWNVGSILQHLDAELAIATLKHVGDVAPLIESPGLVWAFGEYRNRDPFVVGFLESAVREAQDGNAWWRAAYALEKIGVDDAVSLLKRSLKAAGAPSLDACLSRLDDKRSIIGILMASTVANVQSDMYPRVKKTFLSAKDPSVVVNCSWLIGRLKIADEEIIDRLMALLQDGDDELRSHAFFALQHNANERLRPILESALRGNDPLIRKIAARSLSRASDAKTVALLESALAAEKSRGVIASITRALTFLKKTSGRDRLLAEAASSQNENGMIADKSDHWYQDPALYRRYCEAQDPENVCFGLIAERFTGRTAKNPIAISAGAGRALWQMLDGIAYSGTLYGVDPRPAMCAFMEKNLRRERKYVRQVAIMKGETADAAAALAGKSDLIVSWFGFPRRIMDAADRRRELIAVHDLLTDDGEFYTIGGDETFNDEVSALWFRHVPDGIRAWDFAEWRQKRVDAIATPRNCGLAWHKTGLIVPLQFSSVKEAADVMGRLFGRDAGQHVVRTGKTEWEMSLGITRDTKKSLARAIARLEKDSKT